MDAHWQRLSIDEFGRVVRNARVRGAWRGFGPKLPNMPRARTLCSRKRMPGAQAGSSPFSTCAFGTGGSILPSASARNFSASRMLGMVGAAGPTRAFRARLFPSTAGERTISPFASQRFSSPTTLGIRGREAQHCALARASILRPLCPGGETAPSGKTFLTAARLDGQQHYPTSGFARASTRKAAGGLK